MWCAILFLFSTPIFANHEWKSVYDRIMNEPDFSGYRTIIKGNKNMMLSLLYSGVTVFVPNNEAMNKYDGFFNDQLVFYHVGAEVYTLKDLRLNNSIESAFGDNPPLWVTVTEDGYYLNNAKIIEKQSNYVSACKRDKNLKQVLHVVDRVLDPMLEIQFSNPTALDFLENYQNWKLGSRKVSNFFKRVQFNNKTHLYQKHGGHTFFVPINDEKHVHRLNSIDGYIIEGHIIPNQVIFTRPAVKNFIYESEANGDFVYIVLAILNRDGRDFVKSHTVLGNSDHRKGEILAEIVKGNIPVTNGVVHLISQPLAVFDRELKPFPYLSVWYKISGDPELNTTYQIGEKGRINKILRRERGIYTYFVPRDKSWKDYFGYDQDKLSDILERHLIVSDARYTMSKLATTAEDDGTILETLSGSLKLKVVYVNGTFFLIWGRKWIPVIRPDYECNDGVVHVIDGVFAAPKPRVTPKSGFFKFWKSLKDLIDMF